MRPELGKTPSLEGRLRGRLQQKGENEGLVAPHAVSARWSAMTGTEFGFEQHVCGASIAQPRHPLRRFPVSDARIVQSRGDEHIGVSGGVGGDVLVGSVRVHCGKELGFGGVAIISIELARIIFFVFLALFAISLIAGVMRRV